MEVPDSYFDSLPKNLRASMGEAMYSYITSEQFSPECLLDCLDLSSEHQALEVANRIEDSIHVWCSRRSISSHHRNGTTRSSWGMAMDAENSRVFARRAESFLLCLKQRFPGLTQTNLDVCKIQFNKDELRQPPASLISTLSAWFLACNMQQRLVRREKRVNRDRTFLNGDMMDARSLLLKTTTPSASGPGDFAVPRSSSGAAPTTRNGDLSRSSSQPEQSS